jgi:hypothetical protein
VRVDAAEVVTTRDGRGTAAADLIPTIGALATLQPRLYLVVVLSRHTLTLILSPKSVAMMAHVLLISSVIVTLLGGGVVLLIGLWWPLVEPLAQRSGAKPAIAGCRFCLVIVGAFGKNIADDSPAGQATWWWLATTITCGVGWLLWEVVDWWGGEKLKGTKVTVEQTHLEQLDGMKGRFQEVLDQAENARQLALFRVHLLTALRFLVHEKSQCIYKELAESTPKASIGWARDALSPAKHIAFALDQLALFFHQQLPEGEGRTGHNFRVCLYVESNGKLSPMDGFDFEKRMRHPFGSYVRHEQHFRLDNTTDPAHAVRCVQTRSLLIVPDCATDPVFRYLDEGQRTYLKSMVAYPIIDFRRAPQGNAAALVVDTNRPGHFREQDREKIERILEEFAARLIMESAILRAISA